MIGLRFLMFSFKIALVFLAFRAEKERGNRDHPCKTTAEKELTRYEDTFLITFTVSFLKHRKLNAQFITYLVDIVLML